MVQTRGRANKRKLEDSNDGAADLTKAIEPPKKKGRATKATQAKTTKTTRGRGKKSKEIAPTEPSQVEAVENKESEHTCSADNAPPTQPAEVKIRGTAQAKNIAKSSHSTTSEIPSHPNDNPELLQAFHFFRSQFRNLKENVNLESPDSQEEVNGAFTLFYFGSKVYQYIMQLRQIPPQDQPKVTESEEITQALQFWHTAVAESASMDIWETMQYLEIEMRDVLAANKDDLGDDWIEFQQQHAIEYFRSRHGSFSDEVGDVDQVDEIVAEVTAKLGEQLPETQKLDNKAEAALDVAVDGDEEVDLEDLFGDDF